MKKTGQFFTVEDREKRKEGDTLVPVNDIPFRPRVKTIQNVKSVLGECWDHVSSVSWCQFGIISHRDHGVVQTRQEPSIADRPQPLSVLPCLWLAPLIISLDSASDNNVVVCDAISSVPRPFQYTCTHDEYENWLTRSHMCARNGLEIDKGSLSLSPPPLLLFQNDLFSRNPQPVPTNTR